MLYFRFQIATLLPPPRNERLIDLQLSSPVGIQISKCHFLPPPPQKWNVCRFGTLKSSWTLAFKVQLYPLPQKWKVGRVGTSKSSWTLDFAQFFFQLGFYCGDWELLKGHFKHLLLDFLPHVVFVIFVTQGAQRELLGPILINFENNVNRTMGQGDHGPSNIKVPLLWFIHKGLFKAHLT